MSFQNKRDEVPKRNEKVEVAPLPQDKLKTWFPELSEKAHSHLKAYQEEILKFGKVINLISISTVPRIEAVHFADAIMAAKLMAPAFVPKKDIYDFGSGNGFPGMVIAIMFPDAKVILVERDGRKAEFLKHTATKIGLVNVQVVIQAIEDLPDSTCFNAVTRGFAALHKCMLMARKPMAKSGKLFHMKGDGFASELAAVPSQLFSHWNASLLGNYTLPETNSVETVVLTEKLTE